MPLPLDVASTHQYTFESKGGQPYEPNRGHNIEVNITPNPVSDATIRYSIENDSPVLFQVYNLQGQL
jgi:hypothetical protein